MRRLVLHLAVCTAALFLGASAHAGALTGATLGFSLGGGDELVFTADGTVTGSAVSATEVTMAAGGAFAGTLTATLMDAAPATLLSVVIGTNTGGSWNGSPLTGTSVQINGSSIIKGFSGVELIVVPFAAGSVGTATHSGGGIDVTVFSEGWTSGTLAITGLGGATPTVTAMGGITPANVTLVAGARVVTSLADPTFNILTLSMDFESVPEPTMPLLFGAGAAVLGAFAWRKRQA